MSSHFSGPRPGFSFQCNTCGKRFKTYLFLIDHKIRSRDHFFCRRCNLDFPALALLHQHWDTPFTLISDNSTEPFNCTRCRIQYNTMAEFDSHFDTKHPHGCKECRLDFHNGFALQKHLSSAHPDLTGAVTQNPTSEQTENVTTDPAVTPSAPATSESLAEDPPNDASSTSGDAPLTPEDEPPHPSPSYSLPEKPTFPASETQGLPTRTRVFYCDKCGYGFSTLDELKRHLDHSTPVVERHSTPDGGIRCFLCHTTFYSVDGFKQHLQTLDTYHRSRLKRWCIPCLLKFHTLAGLAKHNQSVHVAQDSHESSDDDVSSTSPFIRLFSITLEGEPTVERESTPPPTRAAQPAASTATANAPRLIDSLFASLTPPTRGTSAPLEFARTSPAAGPLPPSPTLTPSVDQPGTITSTPPVSLQASRLDTTLLPSSSTPQVENISGPTAIAEPSPSVRPPRPPRPYNPARLDRLSCHRCQIAFASHQEQIEHLKTGLSAIISDETNQQRMVCAQCKQTTADIHTMKSHLRSHQATCIECLIYFHGSRGLQEHRESSHSADIAAREESSNAQTEGPSNVTAGRSAGSRTMERPRQNPRPPTSAANQTRHHAVSDRQRAPRTVRTVRQISILDFSDTDDDDVPSDIDASHLGGWDLSDVQRSRGPNPNAPAGRTANNTLVRNGLSNRRREPDDDQWWWDGQPSATSWDVVSAGRPSRQPQSNRTAPSTHPKVPRVSSVAIPCSVCLEEAAVDLTSTPCGHVGCETCLRTAVKTKPECPICRKPTKLSDLRPLFL